MKTLEIVAVNTPEGRFGMLIDEHGPFALTGERPWLNNAPNVSCIPAGTYVCQRRLYVRGGYEVFEVTNVPGRTDILIHKGNVPEKDSKGCILVGEMFDPLNGKLAVLSSAKGFGEFMKKLEGEQQFRLVIKEV